MVKRRRRIAAWAAILAAVLAGCALYAWDRTSHYRTTEARIAAVERAFYLPRTKFSATFTYDLTLEYTVGDRLITARVVLVGPGDDNLEPGKTVRIRYRTSRPEACFLAE